jgi:hypothetical protein
MLTRRMKIASLPGSWREPAEEWPDHQAHAGTAQRQSQEVMRRRQRVSSQIENYSNRVL